MKKFLKGLLINSGLIVLIGGVAYLIYLVYGQTQTNITLGIALGLIIGGLILHISVNKLLN